MTTPMENVRKKLAELEQEAEILRHLLLAWEAAEPLLTRVESSVSGVEKNRGQAVDESAIQPSQPDKSPDSKRTRVTDNPKAAVLIPAAIEILRENGKPMSRRALHEALVAKGLEVKGSDPIKALGTILWRAGDKLVQLEGHGYWPKSDHYRPANYAGDLFSDIPNGGVVIDRTGPF